MQDRIVDRGITFDDVLLQPQYSDVIPNEVNVSTRITRNIQINVPLVSSPMDTVTESELAIGLAQEGGLGIIHKNLSIEQQQELVERVKRSENGVIVDPISLPPDATVAQAREIMSHHNIGGVPITHNGKLHGIITRRDLRFLDSSQQQVHQVMTRENLVTASEDTNLEEAERILTEKKVEKLLLKTLILQTAERKNKIKNNKSLFIPVAKGSWAPPRLVHV